MTFRPAVEADADAWQALLGRGGVAGDFLHDWAWAAVAEFDREPQRRFVLEEGGDVVALVAAQERSLPLGRQLWYVPHGPVLDYGDARVATRMRAVVIGLREAARRHRAIAVKLEPRLERGADETEALAGRGLLYTGESLQVAQTRVVELRDDEALLASFDKDTRYAVRRSEREGVTVTTTEDAADVTAVDELHALVEETQRRAGFVLPPLERYRVAWAALAGSGRAAILQARWEGALLAAALVVFEGERSFYLFSGSRREAAGEPKRYASYALQWAMMRLARDRGCRVHDLWGVAPPGAGPEHPWHGVGLFKRGFGGREVRWAGSWDLVVDARLYRVRRATTILRRAARRAAGMVRRRR